MKINILFTLLLFYIPVVFGQDIRDFEEIPSWSEEFNYKGLPDSTKWSYIKGMRGNELQFYTKADKDNVQVKNGYLVIQALKKKLGNANYTSGRIHTQMKASFKYGKIEFRAKFPVGKGIWPAVWMVPVDGHRYPQGEIDIMEYIDCWDNKKYQANVHIVTDQLSRKQNIGYCQTNVSDYHIYTFEWYKDKMLFKMDGNTFYSYLKTSTDWPFDVPYYLVLNIAYGGWGGSCGLDTSIFPCRMKVDWIRYYKLRE